MAFMVVWIGVWGQMGQFCTFNFENKNQKLFSLKNFVEYKTNWIEVRDGDGKAGIFILIEASI